MNRYILLFFTLFFFSRLYGINTDPVFFDSPEYISRISDTNFIRALTSGHIPLHSGYILLFWPIYQLSKFVHLNPLLTVVVFQIILAVVSLYCIYMVIKHFFDSSVAFRSIIIFSLTPLFWVANASFIMETTYFSFFTFFVYFYLHSIKSKKLKYQYIILGSVFFVISFLTHMIVILWTLFSIYLFYLTNKKRFFFVIIFFSFSLMLASLINGYLISPNNIVHGIYILYAGKLQERAQLTFDFISLFSILRNTFIPLLRNYTVLICIFALLGLYKLRNRKKLLYLLVLLILPVVIANQWWDSLLFGRHSLISGIGIALLSSIFLQNKKVLVYLTIIYLLIVSFPTISLLRKDIPYLKLTNIAKQLPSNGLYIESHFARPQVDKAYRGETIFVNEPGFEKRKLDQKIMFFLKINLPVFVSSQALSEPYGLYSGPYLHILSLSYKNDFSLKEIMKNYTIRKFKIINDEDNLIVYKVISNNPSQYPVIPLLRNSKRRLDYYDPFIQMWLFLRNRSQNWMSVWI